MMAVTRRWREAAICVATARRQTSSYSARSFPKSSSSAAVFILAPAGRIASCASWAELARVR